MSFERPRNLSIRTQSRRRMPRPPPIPAESRSGWTRPNFAMAAYKAAGGKVETVKSPAREAPPRIPGVMLPYKKTVTVGCSSQQRFSDHQGGGQS